MAKRKTVELSVKARISNAEADAKRAREKQLKIKNCEKQKRFREGMKYRGYKQVLLWALPCPADTRGRMEAAGFRQAVAWESEKSVNESKKYLANKGKIKVAANIKESSLFIAARSPEVKEALNRAEATFLHAMEKAGVKDAVGFLIDYHELTALLCDPDDN